MLSTGAWTTLAILVAMFALLVWNKLPIWLVFISTVTVAMTLRLAPAAALLKGFSNTGVITVAALYPVAAGMYSTGAISLLSERLIGLPKSITMAQIKILTPVSIASAFLYNTPLVAMMIPAVRDVTRRTGLIGSKLFMGLSYVALLGGTVTLIGTSVNLIVAGLVSEAVANGTLAAMKPIGLFDPMWIGLPATATGLVFMILIGPRLLRDRTAKVDVGAQKRMFRSEFRVEQGSKLAGKTLEQAGFARPVGYNLESVTRRGSAVEPAPEHRLEEGDLLTFSASAEALPGLWTTIGLVPAYATKMSSKRHEHHLVELVLSARSPAIGHRVSELPLPDSPYELMLVGVSRDGQTPSESLADLRLEAGDAGIVEVGDAFFYENRRETDFILTKRLEGFRVQRIDRALVALAITIGMIALAAFRVTDLLNAALLATLAMLITGCLTIPRLWQSIDWQTLVVLGSAIGLESAATGTGLAKAAADLFVTMGGGSPMMALAAVYIGTVLLTNVITNVASAVLMFSVAVSLATSLSVSFLPFAMILMSGASCAFISPAGFQTNLMVQGPGGYTFGDFARVGLPLTAAVGAVVLVLAPIVYGF
ncbi:MAG TPA: SLC13 family permease [Blastocatellia bacterium]|nr:SLC13 family permease [Blastocatellia bacterium]